MNDLQKELLNILECFIKICDEFGLDYYLSNGSALGAEKYGGFIPWDDDIDVVMPRKDYDLFCEKANENLPQHLFLQNFKTDSQFPLLYSKIRNSNTTFIENNVKHLCINHGIYMDIFPLDGYPDNIIGRTSLIFKMKILRCMQFCGFENSTSFHKCFLRKLGFHKKTDKTLSKMEKLLKKYGSDTVKCCDYSDRQDRGLMPREYYGIGKTSMFEHLKVKIPYMIDEYLTYKYGDWKSDLPKEFQVSHHKTTHCDLENSYLDYINS